jgi:hypothetical protein
VLVFAFPSVSFEAGGTITCTRETSPCTHGVCAVPESVPESVRLQVRASGCLSFGPVSDVRAIRIVNTLQVRCLRAERHRHRRARAMITRRRGREGRGLGGGMECAFAELNCRARPWFL